MGSVTKRRGRLEFMSCRPRLLWAVVGTVVLVIAATGLQVGAAGVDKSMWNSNNRKLSGLIIPGFASTRLRAWALLDCPYSPLDFSPLDDVWVDIKKVLSVLNCWLKCMLLDPITQADHPDCKSRPDTGLSAITELAPGFITGPLSSVWREWVNWCVEFGIEPDAIIAAPYDWRLSGPMLQERDFYFHKLKLQFETARVVRGGPALVFGHSLGNNVFRYFLEWLKLEIAPKLYNQWLDDHVHAYFAVATPYLGSAQTIKAMLSGLTFGLPISEGTARMMTNSFAASLWMLPFSEHCHADQKHCSKWMSSVPKGGAHLVCAKQEYSKNESSWPVDIVKVDFPVAPGMSAYPKIPVGPESDSMTAFSQCRLPVTRSYSAHEVADGTFLEEISELDPTCKVSLNHLYKSYLEDPILNPLTPWERPPIKNVYCIYGINLKTEAGYHFAPNGKSYPDNWMVTDITYETEGGHLQSRSGAAVNGNRQKASGDTTVTYNSLSWCKKWLGPRVNITRTPQGAHDGYDVQEEFYVEHDGENDITPINMTRDSHLKYITFYEDGISRSGYKTAVWEMDKVEHRNIVRSSALLRELWLETAHHFHPEAKRQFVSKVLCRHPFAESINPNINMAEQLTLQYKAKREPMRDEDCFWDYGGAKCGCPERCEYRYVFGDVHLGQSCRLRTSSEKDHLSKYL